MLCYVNAMQCNVIKCYVTLRYVTLRHVTSRHVTSRHVTSRHVMFMLCYVMLCYVMLCYVTLMTCHVMSCHVYACFSFSSFSVPVIVEKFSTDLVKKPRAIQNMSDQYAINLTTNQYFTAYLQGKSFWGAFINGQSFRTNLWHILTTRQSRSGKMMSFLKSSSPQPVYRRHPLPPPRPSSSVIY